MMNIIAVLITVYYLLMILMLIIGAYEDNDLTKKDLLLDFIPFHGIYRIAKNRYNKLK